MKKPTLQDILEEGIRYFKQLPEYEYCSYRKDRLTILQVMDKGVQHYVRIAREEYKRENVAKTVEKNQNTIRGWDGPDSSEGRRYE